MQPAGSGAELAAIFLRAEEAASSVPFILSSFALFDLRAGGAGHCEGPAVKLQVLI